MGPPPAASRGQSGASAIAGPRGRLAVFDSFRIRSYRFQWSSDGFDSWANEMEALILAWFVLVETESAFLVGLVGALRFLGTLLGPIYGVVVDRVDRRLLQIAVRGFFAVVASITLFLATTGTLETWHVFVIATLLGFGRMFDNVVRQSLVADVVPRRNLLNAIGLSRSAQEASKITGALAAGSLLARLGIGPAYAVIVGIYAASTLLAFGISVRSGPSAARASGAWSNLREGVGYIRRHETIAGIMFLAFVVNLTAFPLTNGLMPVVARDVFETGPEGLASLTSAAAGGALIGAVFLAAAARSANPMRSMLFGIFAWHMAMIGFSQLTQFAFAIVVLLVLGVFMSLSMVSMSGVLLTTAAREFRGRVLGVRSLAVYGLQIGLLLSGFLAGRYGIEATLIFNGVVGLALSAFAVLKWRSLLARTPSPPLD